MTYRAYRKSGNKKGLTADMSSPMRGPVVPRPALPAGNARRLSKSTRPPGDVRPGSPRDGVLDPGQRLTPGSQTPRPQIPVARGGSVPNRTGNPHGYNKRLLPTWHQISKAFKTIGYNVKSSRNKQAGVAKFQEDFNKCSRRFSFKWGKVSVTGLVTPDTLRALEIVLVFARQRQKKMHIRGLKRTMAQCWRRACKRSGAAARVSKGRGKTRAGRKARRVSGAAGPRRPSPTPMPPQAPQVTSMVRGARRPSGLFTLR